MRRIFALALFLTFGAVTLSAATTYLEICGTKVQSTGMISSSYILSGTAYFNENTKTLTLNNIDISATGNNNGIYIATDGITIVFVGAKNSITAYNKDRNAIRMDKSGLNLTISGYDSAARVTLKGGSNKSGLHLEKQCTCTISNLTMITSGKWGIDGSNGTSSEKLVLDAGAIIRTSGTTAAVADMASMTLDKSLTIFSPEGGSFSTSKHGIVDSSGSLATSAEIGETYGIKVAGTKVTSQNAANCGYSGTGYVKYDKTTKTLTVSNAKILTDKNQIDGISVETDGITIEFIGTSTISADGNAIRQKDGGLTTTIKGYNTSAKVELNSINFCGLSIGKIGSCTITGLTLNANGSIGICGANGTSGEKLTIKSDAIVTTTGSLYAIYNLASFTVESPLVISTPEGIGQYYQASHLIMAHGNRVKTAYIGEPYGMMVCGVPVVSANALDCGFLQEGTVRYDKSTNTLSLASVRYFGDTFVENESNDGLTIKFSGTSNIYCYKGNNAMVLQKNTTITGTGTLTLDANILINGATSEAIVVKGTGTKLTLAHQGTLNVHGSEGINLNGTGTILNVTATGDLTMNGITSNGSEVSFTGTGKYKVTAHSVAGYNGIWLKADNAKLTIGDNVKDMNIEGSSDGYGIYAGGKSQQITIGAATGLTISGSGAMSGAFASPANTLTFKKTTAFLEATGNERIIKGFGTVKLDNCDVSTPGGYLKDKEFYKKGQELWKSSIELKPVTTTYKLYFGDRQLNDVNCKEFFCDGMITGDASYNASSNTLTMNSVYMNWKGAKNPAFDNWGVDNLTIVLNGTNAFVRGNDENKDPVVRFRGNTTVKGGSSKGNMTSARSTEVYDNFWIGNSSTLTVASGAELIGSNITGDNKGTLVVNNADVGLKGDNSTPTIEKLAELTLTKAYFETPADAYYNTSTKKLVTSAGAVKSKVIIMSGEPIIKGDANGNGKVNVADIVEMVNYKNKRKASSNFNLKAADMDSDGNVTKADIDQVVKIIMSGK